MPALPFSLVGPLGGDGQFVFAKVQTLISLMPPVYNLDEGGVLTGLLEAIGTSDEDIGGF